jgi:hypothetical protein
MDLKRGVAIIHYDRAQQLPEQINAIKQTVPPGTKVVVCDDGTTGGLNIPNDTLLVKGPNMGVAYNKNRALWALQDCHFLALIEDDLIPKNKGWFEVYEEAAIMTQTNHFCRVQDKEISDNTVGFSAYLEQRGYTPVFGSSPRGDLVFITSAVLAKVGAFNPKFKGVGYAHGEWQNRIAKAGLINHPLKWFDIKEARDCFEQKGDTSGGRWKLSKTELKKQLDANKKVLVELEKDPYIHLPLRFE